jgi:hypothetical protein
VQNDQEPPPGGGNAGHYFILGASFKQIFKKNIKEKKVFLFNYDRSV